MMKRSPSRARLVKQEGGNGDGGANDTADDPGVPEVRPRQIRDLRLSFSDSFSARTSSMGCPHMHERIVAEKRAVSGSQSHTTSATCRHDTNHWPLATNPQSLPTSHLLIPRRGGVGRLGSRTHLPSWRGVW